MSKNIFSAHPASVGETYLQHWLNATLFSFKLIFTGLACLVHAVLPFLFIDAASDCVAKMTVKFKSGQRSKGFNEKLEQLEQQQGY